MISLWVKVISALVVSIICLPQVVFAADLTANGGVKNQSLKSTYQRQVNKKQAMEIVMKELQADLKYTDGNLAIRGLSDCLVTAQVNAIFINGVNSIEVGGFKERLKVIQENKPSESMQKELVNCITAIIPQEYKSSTDMSLITTDDFRLDYSSLSGKKVRVEGEVLFLMNVFMLKKNNMDMSPIPIDVSNLQRDEQKKILQECATLASVCKGVVYGIAGKVMYQNGILAEGIQWRIR